MNKVENHLSNPTVQMVIGSALTIVALALLIEMKVLMAALCFWRYKQLLSKSIPMLEVQILVYKSTPYAGGTNSSYLKSPLYWKNKQLHSKSTPYSGGTNSCFLKASLRWRYKQLLYESTFTLEVQPYAGVMSLCWWY